MLIIGSPNAIIPVANMYPFIVYNVSSNLVNPSIKNLSFMQMQGLDYKRKDIDDQFYNIVLNNDIYFCDLMNIVIPLKSGSNVALLVYREEELFDPFSETIGKLIQQRYGYNYQLLNEADDFNPYDDSSFNINGVFYLDQDINRYINIMARVNPKAFINEHINDSHF